MDSNFDKSENKSKDTVFTYFPTIALILSILQPIYLLYTINSTSTTKTLATILTEVSIPFLKILLIFFSINFITFYLYKWFLLSIRNNLVKFWLIFMLSTSTLNCLYLFLNYNNNQMAASGLIFFLLVILYYYYFKKDLKTSANLIKHSLETIKKMKVPVFTPFVKLYTFLIISMSSYTFYEMIIRNEREILPQLDGMNITLILLNVVSAIYLFEVLSAVNFLYGASILDNYSYKHPHFIKKAKEIALERNYGSACFGAFIMTLIRILRVLSDSRDKNGNRTLLGIIAYAIMCAIEDLAEFVTSQAYIHAAMYGKGLFGSAKMAWGSFSEKGFERFFNFSTTNTLLMSTNLAFSVFFSALSSKILMVTIFDGITDELERGAAEFFLYVLMIIPTTLCPGIWNNVVAGMSMCGLSIAIEDPERFRDTYENYEKIEKVLYE